MIHGLLAGVALVALGCGSSADTTAATSAGGGSSGAGGGAQQGEVLDLFSWWIAPGEAEALQALVDTYKKDYPNDRVANSGNMSGAEARALLAMRIDSSPPDVFQLNAQDTATFMHDHPNTVASLDEFFADPTYNAAVLPDVKAAVSVDGHVQAMPVGIHRTNSLFYGTQVFADNKITPPTTVPAFLDVCKQLKAAGVTPLAMAYQGFVLRHLFNSFVMGIMGPTTFKDFMSGKRPISDPDINAALTQAIDVLDEVLTNYVNEDAGADGFTWTNAADLVHDGKAAMFIHGDWAKGYFVQLGWDPGVDFGQTGAPGSSELFWYGVDVFMAPVHAPHPKEAHDFLTVVGSKEGQAAFNRLKGSTPTRTDVRDMLDDLGKHTLDDLVNAKIRMQVVNKAPWDVGLVAFAKMHDKDALLQVYVTNPP